MSVRTLSNITVTIQKLTKTKNAVGSIVTATSSRYSNVPCRIQPMSGKEQAIYNTETTVADHVMFIPDPTTYSGIVETDKVVYGTRTFDITLVRNIDIMSHHYECELRELKGYS